MNLNVKTKKLFGEEEFSNGMKLFDFWSWAHSDLMNNAERGKLAEFIVSTALGCKFPYRVEWDAYDLLTEDGIKIEIKSSAYLQTWKQTQYSKIIFGISPTKYWDEETHKYSSEKVRRSDFYVFCLLTCKDPQKVNPLELSQWDFYVVKTSDIDIYLKSQSSITLNSLIKLPHIKTDYYGLKNALQNLNTMKN